MTFVDVPTTARKRMTKSRALRIWEMHGGLCVTCGRQIDGVRDRWFVEHIRALELGGDDVDANCGPAHTACKAEKDAADHGSAAKAKRMKQASMGIKDPTRRAIRGPGFRKAAPQRRASSPLTKQCFRFGD
jgi:5-methylcytosine-specific restriction protein A